MKKFLYLGLLLAFPPASVAADSPRSIYTIATVAGSSSLGDGGPAIDAQLGAIQGIAADRLGNLYLSDTDHHLVRKIDPTGAITTIAGTGVAGFSGDSGPATAAQLNLPYGLAVDAAGNLYIADLNNNRVRLVTPAGVIQTYAGSGGQASNGDGGPATAAHMLSPRNLAVDSTGNLYIAEFAAHRVRKVAPDGLISTAAGTGIAGFRGDGGPATAAQLAFPAGLALDRNGSLYIADSQNQRIRQVVPTGQIVTFAGASPGITLLTPLAIAVDQAGDLFIADTTSAVREFTTAGKWIAAAGTSAAGFSGDGGPATSAQLNDPLGLTLDPAGNLFIADQHRVRQVRKGLITTVAGANYLHGIGDGSSATAAELYLPSAATVDSFGNLYIADTGTNRVRKVTPSGIMTTVAGTGVAAPGGEATPAATTSLIAPTAVALDDAGNLLIVETGANRIRQIAADGRIHTIDTQTPLRDPRAVCLDRSANLYVVDSGNSRVLRVPPVGTVVTAAGNGASGSAGDGGPGPLAQLNQPTACGADSAGNLYIADTGNNRIRRVDTAGDISTVAVSVSLNAPRGVAVDDEGNLFISDTGNNSIRQITPDGVIHTIAGVGAAGFSGDGGPALSASLNAPGGLLLDGSGDLYIADTNNNRIRLLVPAGIIAPPSVDPPTPLSVVNAASLRADPVAPGEVVTIYGSAMGPQTGVSALIDPSRLLVTELAGVQVLFDGVPAPLFYAQSSQINAQVPYTVSGQATTNVQVLYEDVAVNTTSVAVASAAPGVFPTAINQDGTYNTAANPAATGSYITIFATGAGLTGSANITGQPAAAPYPPPDLPVTASVSGVQAQIVWVGSAPGLVGLLQVNLIVPGPYLPTGTAPLQLTVGTAISPTMAIWVQ